MNIVKLLSPHLSGLKPLFQCFSKIVDTSL